MIRRPPRSTRTDTLFPYTTLFRSKSSIDGGVFLEYCINTLIHCAPMKQRPKPRSERDAEASMKALVKSLAALDRPEDVAAFLEDLFTPAELEAMADRWRVVPLLLKGVAYRYIHEPTRVIFTTLGLFSPPLYLFSRCFSS